MARLRTRGSVSALALEWTILPCARTSMTIGLPAQRVRPGGQGVEIPAERMKEDPEHRVLLIDRCIEIFDELEVFGRSGCSRIETHANCFQTWPWSSASASSAGMRLCTGFVRRLATGPRCN